MSDGFSSRSNSWVFISAICMQYTLEQQHITMAALEQPNLLLNSKENDAAKAAVKQTVTIAAAFHLQVATIYL